jgi:hypothetical protein
MYQADLHVLIIRGNNYSTDPLGLVPFAGHDNKHVITDKMVLWQFVREDADEH